MRTLSPNPTPVNSGIATSDPQLPAIATSPLLQAALSGLDISLDEELDRYRHWQANGQRTSYVNAFRPLKTSTPTSEVIGAKSSGSSSPQLPVTRSVSVKSEPIKETKPTQATEPNYLEHIDEEMFEPASIPASALVAALSNNTSVRNESLSSEELNEDDLLRDIADNYGEEELEPETESSDRRENSEGILSNLFTPLGIASLLLLLLSSAVIGYLLVDPSGLTKLVKPKQSNPSKNNSYLPDSANEPNLQAKQNLLDSENLLVEPKNSKVPFVVPLPGSISRPGQTLGGFTSGQTPKNSSPKISVSSNKIDNNLPSALATPTREVPATNLSYQSLPTFSSPPVVEGYEPPVRPRSTSNYTSPIQSSSSPRALPPSTTAASSNLIPANPASTVRFKPTESNSSKLPLINSSSSASAPPVQYAAPVVSNPPSGSGYKVIVDNSYVSQAQQADPNAFVRPSDGNLQLGAYSNANAAQNRAEELRRQGIPARVDR